MHVVATLFSVAFLASLLQIALVDTSNITCTQACTNNNHQQRKMESEEQTTDRTCSADSNVTMDGVDRTPLLNSLLTSAASGQPDFDNVDEGMWTSVDVANCS